MEKPPQHSTLQFVSLDELRKVRKIPYHFGRLLFPASIPAYRQEGLVKRLRSNAMRLFHRFAIGKNALAENKC